MKTNAVSFAKTNAVSFAKTNAVSFAKKQAGFTLIELIIVLVILGILAAMALPRFANLGPDARLASAEGALGAVQSASSIAHGAWLVQASSTATTVPLEGTTIDMVNGYPDHTDAGIIRAANIVDGQGYSVTHDNSTKTVKITPEGVTTPANCQVQYTPPANSNQQPTIVLTATTPADCS